MDFANLEHAEKDSHCHAQQESRPIGMRTSGYVQAPLYKQ